MTTLLSLIGALALSAVPIVLGWRRTYSDAQMARQLGITQQKKRLDPEKFARQTGTGLTWKQILFGFSAWVIGGFFAGAIIGPVPAFLFAIAGGLLYAGVLTERREDHRLRQAKDILRGIGIMETVIGTGVSFEGAVEAAAIGTGPDGRDVFSDLLARLRGGDVNRAKEVQEWSQLWDNPAVDYVAVCLIAAFGEDGRTSGQAQGQLHPLISSLRNTLSAVVEILSRARAAAKGVEWQAKFLALFPPAVLVVIGITTPEAGRMYATNPILLLPVVLGSGLSYYFSNRMIRNGLSIEASMGLQAGEEGMIRLDRMGKVL